MLLYRSVYQEAETELTIQRSKFITHVTPVESYEEAQAYVAMIREEYRDATHNVPAVIVGSAQELKWASDDGEPQGTSGPPMLKLLSDSGLTNLAVVVTRYFGGVKLGTGGLVRAYTESARLGIEAAGICEVRNCISARCCVEYSVLSKIQNKSREGLYKIDQIDYTDKVALEISYEPEREAQVVSLLNDLTSGACVLTEQKNGLIRTKIG